MNVNFEERLMSLERNEKQSLAKKIHESINGKLDDNSRIQIARMILEKYAPELLKTT